MSPQARAILWAQWRSIWNYYPSSRKGQIWFTAVVGVLWYGIWTFAGVSVGLLTSRSNPTLLARILPAGLLLVFLYWQIVPIMMASSGMSLDLKKLVVYPVPPGDLFAIEVLLRITTSVEMLIIVAGAAAGLSFNPRTPWWTAFAFIPFVLFNLFFSAGLRDLLARLLARKHVREVLVFGFVLLGALPQILLMSGAGTPIRRLFSMNHQFFWPWSATAGLALGSSVPIGVFVLIVWTGGAFLFGRWQFSRSLRFDAAAQQSSDRRVTRRDAITERLFRIPSRLFRDPLGGLIEKEVRFLCRSPRFRLVFLMGFSFGLIIWLPLILGGNREPSMLSTNYLSIVSVYALMLLGEVCFWNSFGFDRSAAQLYFVVPVKFSTVLVAKNITAAFFIFLEIGMVTIVCALLRMPVTLRMAAEAFAVAVVLTVLLLSAGNMTSTRNPRAVDPAQGWRSSAAGRVQAFLLLIYPAAMAPVLLAYGARYAFDSDLAFYGVLLVDLILGLVFYSVALESSVNAAQSGREHMITVLSRGEGPVAG